MRIGKSSLLRDCLAPYRDRLGGFSSQRLLLPGGTIAGYRLAPAWDFQVEQPYDPSLDGVFLSRSAGNAPSPMRFDSALFLSRIQELLQEASSYPLLLLDEVGGPELLEPAFCHLLEALLAGSTPCIGVWKSQTAALAMSRRNPKLDSLPSVNASWRRRLEREFSGELLAVAPPLAPYGTYIEEFLHSLPLYS